VLLCMDQEAACLIEQDFGEIRLMKHYILGKRQIVSRSHTYMTE